MTTTGPRGAGAGSGGGRAGAGSVLSSSDGFVVGSSLVSVAVFGFTTAATYAWHGDVLWDVAGLMILGGAAGSALGVWTGRRLAARRSALQRVFAAFIVAVAAYVVWRTLGA